MSLLSLRPSVSLLRSLEGSGDKPVRRPTDLRTSKEKHDYWSLAKDIGLSAGRAPYPGTRQEDEDKEDREVSQSKHHISEESRSTMSLRITQRNSTLTNLL